MITKNCVARNMLEKHIVATAWVEGKTKSRKDPKSNPPSLAPNHYGMLNFKAIEGIQPVSTFPKDKGSNFIDKNTRN